MQLKFKPWSPAESAKAHGYTIVTAAFFIVGEMAGAGIAAMPGAMENSYWYGILLLLIGVIASWYTGCELGWCWTMLQEIWPDYRSQTRKPYPEIGKMAFGERGFSAHAMKVTISVCIVISLFGASTLYSILAAQEIDTVISTFTTDTVGVGWLVFIVIGALWPITLLGSMADFWWVSACAAGSSTVACILIIAGSAIDSKNPPFFLFDNQTTTPSSKSFTGDTTSSVLINSATTLIANATVAVTTAATVATKRHVTYSLPSFKGIVTAWSTIAGAYGGHSCFPTMQHDMKQPQNFPKAVGLGYAVICLLYFPTAIVAYTCYGDLLSGDYNGNITKIIQTDWIRVAISILIGSHVCFGILISINPVNQEIEELIGMPKHFTWKRLVSRTVVIWLVCFVGESIPHFSTLLSFLGASTITALTFIFPPICYLSLKRKRRAIALAQIPPEHMVAATAKGYHIFTTSPQQQIEGNGIGVDTYRFKAPISIPEGVKAWEYAVNVIIVVVGLLAGLGGLYGSINEFITKYKFQQPCYLQRC